MNHWLVKSEPSAYSWADLVKDGKTVWSGVRNFQARNNLAQMQRGDLVLFYHSNDGKEIVGVAEVVTESFIDPTDSDSKWIAVEIAAKYPLKRAVKLEEVKKHEVLKAMKLSTHSRLSVSEVSENEFQIILAIGLEK